MNQDVHPFSLFGERSINGAQSAALDWKRWAP